VNDDKVRRNNASNLIDNSNKWIADVMGWVEAVGINSVKERLSIRTDADLAIHLIVLGRYHAHFTSTRDHDPRAVWCDWGNFLRQRTQQPNESASEFVESLGKSVEHTKTEVKPESLFFPLGDKTIVLVNPIRTDVQR